VKQEGLCGTVQSHTVIRAPGRRHSGTGPFVLLLVELADGRRVLGRFTGADPPPINSRVVGRVEEDDAALFSLAETRA
jgi:uncharacterized OB-fold protein